MRLVRIAFRNAHRLIPSEPIRRKPPDPPLPTVSSQLRLHLFGSHFDDSAGAETFCYDIPAPDLPTALNRELKGAFIDPNEVEVIWGDIKSRLMEFLSAQDADDVLLRLAGDNTLIIITEHAFGGLPYELDDTDQLTYLGSQLVDV